MSTDIYYFELRESCSGRLSLQFMGNEDDLRDSGEELGSQHYRANEIGISVDSIHTYLAVKDDFCSHIGIHGHHEDEDRIPQDEWSEEKKKYENMWNILKTIEDEWNETAQALSGTRLHRH